MKNKIETLFNDKNRAEAALLRVFPSKEHYLKFRNENKVIARMSVPSFFSFAKEMGFIETETEKEFVQYIENRTISLNQKNFETHLNFYEIISEISGNNSINWLVDQLNKIALYFNLPKVQASMITRLKKKYDLKTPKKKVLILLIAFWIGYNKPEFNWNYHTLLYLPDEMNKSGDITQENEGIRIDISFQGQDEIIDFDMIKWLENEIPTCISDLKMFHLFGKKVSFYSTTTATLEIPKKTGVSGEIRLYDQAVRDSLTIAHQIINRWILANIEKRHISIVVAITAGKFSALSIMAQTLIESKIKRNPAIRLTEYAKMCARVTDVKVIFDENSTSVSMPSGMVIHIWSVKYFWFLYYDFIPSLLNEKMLPMTHKSYENFRDIIKYHQDFYKSNNIPIPKALLAIRQFPQNDMLALEIVKVCVSRRMFNEANKILSTIFAFDPYHVVARTFRMLIFINMAMEHSEYLIFNLYFKKAEEEANLIQKHCIEDDEVWIEIGLLYYGRALFYIHLLRKKVLLSEEDKKNINAENILTNISKALSYLHKGETFSPTGLRSIFWIVHLKALKHLIELNPNALVNGININDTQKAYAEMSARLFITSGWLSSEYLKTDDIDVIVKSLKDLFKQIMPFINIYSNSAQLRVYAPNVSYAIATVLWDFSPIITVQTGKRVLEWLEKAKKDANALVEENLGLYSIVSWYYQIQSPKHFVFCVDRTIKKVFGIIKEQMNDEDDTIIDDAKINGIKLMLMHLDEEVKSGVLLVD